MSIELRSQSHSSTKKLLAFIKQECSLSDDEMIEVERLLKNRGYIAIRDGKLINFEHRK